MSRDRLQHAWELLQQAYQSQMQGDYDQAIKLYTESLNIFPTAEAHTFLGWTYHFQGKIADAIAECKRAIEVDPEFGNPYNDIGSPPPPLEKKDATAPRLYTGPRAPRYDPRHFPPFNLGRAYAAKGMLARARECFNESLRIEPRYTLARQAVESLRRMVN